MQKYSWKVITASVDNADPAKSAETNLNQLQDTGYEIFATHALSATSAGWLVIIARKPKVDASFDKRY